MLQELERLRAQVKEYESILFGRGDRLAELYKLPPQSARLLSLLVSLDVVTPEAIRVHLAVTDHKVPMNRLRKLVEPQGIEIISRKLVGYWIAPETKEKIQEQLDGVSPALVLEAAE